MTGHEKELRAAWRAAEVTFAAHCEAVGRLRKAREAATLAGMTAPDCWRALDDEAAKMAAETKP